MREKDLWPAVPNNVEAMEEWIGESQRLLLPLPKYSQRLKTLQDPQSRADMWERDTLSKLITELENLNEDLLPRVQERLQLAKTIEERSLGAYAREWKEAIADIQEDPTYKGLQLKPQLGLVPLGKNTQGLWEFGHLLSGMLPQKDAQGSYIYKESTGIVLVLIPKGVFVMGATSIKGGKNFDPRAADIEQPPHDVSLEAFFASKYEMTQSQWLRVQRTNPSAYLPGTKHGKYTTSTLHPVEHMTWNAAKQTVDRLGLTLPTEAQWEYINRAGSQSVYWGGDSIASMRGKLNISDRVSHENGGPASWKFEKELDDGYIIHAPVGTFQANAFGLHDTSGNVWEWCLDRYGAYTLATDKVSGARLVEKEDAPRLFRGGGFRASSVHARSADRYSIYAHDYSAYDVGLRAIRRIE